MNDPRAQAQICLLLMTAIGVTLIAYWPGLGGTFVLDDFNSLRALNDYGGVTDWTSFLHYVFGNGTGPLGRPVSMFSFLINDQYWPGSPWFYKYVNLLIHTLVGVLAFAFTRSLLRQACTRMQANIAALAVMALWLLHPLNVSTTLYIVQRMAQLSALFTLAGLLCYLPGRALILKRPRAGFLALSVGVGLCGALAVLSKENGLLLIAYIAVVEFTIFAGSSRPAALRYWLWLFIAAPALLFAIYRGLSWERLAATYAWREVTPIERLLTESRILCMYLKEILLPSVGGMGLFHDDIEISRGLFSPPGTALACLAVAGLILGSLAARKVQPILSFAILWFFAGHLMESTIIPLELYFAHRNYLAMLGPLVGLVYYSYVGLRTLSGNHVVRLAGTVLPAGLLGLYLPMTAHSATVWSDPLLLFSINEVEHQGSLRAKRAFAFELERHGQIAQAMRVADQARKEHPDDVAVLLYMLALECDYGLDSGVSLKDIRERRPDATVRDGLIANLDRLTESVESGECPDTLDPEMLVDIYRTVEGIPDFDKRRKIAARIYFLHAGLEIALRRLPPAMNMLDKAYALQPTVDIALKQTVVLASAGLYKEALARLQTAKQAAASRPLFLPSRMPELRQVEKSLQQQIKEADPNQNFQPEDDVITP